MQAHTLTSAEADDVTSRLKTSPAARSQANKSHTEVRLNARLLTGTLVCITISGMFLLWWYNRQLVVMAESLRSQAQRYVEEEKWPEAAELYNRYLALQPSDGNAHSELAKAFAHEATTFAKRRQLSTILYRALGHRPDDFTLRQTLAANLLDIGEHQAAIKEAKVLLSNAEYAAQGGRVFALSQYALSGADHAAAASAAAALTQAIADLPGDLQLASTTAFLLRTQPDLFGKSSADAARRADDIMNEMVAANPNNADAYLGRFRYRNAFKLDDCEADLEAALTASPTHLEALLISASRLLGGPRQDESAQRAEPLINRLIVEYPHEPRGYLFQAQLMARGGKVDDALSALETAQKVAAPNVAVPALQVTLLIDQGSTQKARQALIRLTSMIDEQSVELPRQQRQRVENEARALEAHIDLMEGNPSRAASSLRAVVAATASDTGAGTSTLAARAMSLLAMCQERLGYWELAGPQWQEVGDLTKSIDGASGQRELGSAGNAFLRAGRAFLHAQQPDAAIGALEKHLDANARDVLALALLIDAHRATQLQREPSERNWAEAASLLERGQSLDPTAWEIAQAGIDLHLAQARISKDGDLSAIQDELGALERQFKHRAEYWRSSALLYDEMKLAEQSEAAIVKYCQLTPSPVECALLKAQILSNRDRWKEADDVLLRAALELPADQRTKVNLRRMQILAVAGQHVSALEIAEQGVAQGRDVALYQKLALEIASATGDIDAANRWESALAKCVGYQDFDIRFLRAKRLLTQYESLSSDQRASLAREVDALRGDRPRWFPATAISAQLAQSAGNLDAAVRDYRVAVELGDRRPDTLQNLVALLTAQGHLEEAERYLSKLKGVLPENWNFEAMEIALAIKSNQPERAVSLAQDAVKREPKDPLRRVWLANSLAIAQRQAEAEAEFDVAVNEFPDKPAVWNGSLLNLVRAGQKDKARDLLKRMSEQTALPQSQRHFWIGQGYEMLGDGKRALECYRAGVAANPSDATVRLRLAKQLLASDLGAARRELEVILKDDSSHAEAARLLAALLASSGDANDWQRAMQLLDGSSSDDSLGNDRLRALLLTKRGRSREEKVANLKAARLIVQGQLENLQNATADLDRLILAGIHEQEGRLKLDVASLEAGRGVLRHLVDRPDPQTASLSQYIQYVLRNLASPAVVSLSKDDRSALQEAWLNDASSRIDELASRLPKDAQGVADVLSMRVSLLKARGESSAAIQLIDDYLSSDDRTGAKVQQAQKYLVAGNLYAGLAQKERAEECYRSVTSVAPDAYPVLIGVMLDNGKAADAVAFCLQVAKERPTASTAATLAQALAHLTPQDRQYEEARAELTKALDSHEDDIPLLSAAAALHVSQGDNDKAIEYFRRITQLTPNDAVALNNLATLLGETPSRRAEAIDCVQRAIAIVGQTPALLDTLGTIHLNSEQFDDAIVCLEEATLGGAADPRYHFHLAASYQGAGRLDEARQAYQTAIAGGIRTSLLTEHDKQLLAGLEKAIAPQSSSTAIRGQNL